MKIWIFIALINISDVQVIMLAPDNIKYAFQTKASCEYAIALSKNLKCIELELLK